MLTRLRRWWIRPGHPIRSAESERMTGLRTIPTPERRKAAVLELLRRAK